MENQNKPVIGEKAQSIATQSQNHWNKCQV